MSSADEVKVSILGQDVLGSRALFPDATLANLYDPDLMPPALPKIHQTLDKAFERLYRKLGFAFERERGEHLLMIYDKLVAPLEAAASANVKKGRKTAGR